MFFIGLVRNTQFPAINLLVKYTFKRRFIQLKMSLHTQLFSGFERLKSKLDLSRRPCVSKKYFAWQILLKNFLYFFVGN